MNGFSHLAYKSQNAARSWRSPSVYGWGLVGLWGFALGLRCWGLGRFNDLVFDEIYFVKFAHHYLSGTPFFDAHPPLGKYLIALGMWWGEQIAPQVSPRHELVGPGIALAPIHYRWMNAFVGSFVPVTVAGVVRRCWGRAPNAQVYALAAAALVALDGLLLVESRYALLNVYVLELGLLAHWLALWGCQQRRYRWLLLSSSGIFLGAAIAVKWNALGFWLGWFSLWAIAGIWKRWPGWQRPRLLRSLGSIGSFTWIGYWGILPGLTYLLLWIPHLYLNDVSVVMLHQQILGYHQSVGSGLAVHPYCSAWYTWPVMLRPVAYFYQTLSGSDPLPDWAIGLAPLRPEQTVVYDVHAMGNPVLWGLSTAAIACLTLIPLLRWACRQIQRPLALPWLRRRRQAPPPIVFPALYLGLNYGAHWLPWLLVSRCVFLYHYLDASIVAMMALAIVLVNALQSPRLGYRLAGWTMAIAIGVAFLFWLPLYLGLPLSPSALQWRWWLRSWV